MLRIGIAQKLSVLAVSIVVIASIATGVIILNNSQEQLSNLHMATLAQMLNSDSAVIEKDMLALQQDLNYLSLIPSLQAVLHAGYTPENSAPQTKLSTRQWKTYLSQIFKEYLKSKPNYEELRVIGVANQGQEILTIIKKAGIPVESTPAELESHAHTSYFKETIALEPPAVYLSPIALKRDQGRIFLPKTPEIRAAIALKTPDHHPVGMIVITMNLSSLFQSVRTNTVKNSILYATNETGDFILHPDPAKTFGFELGQHFRAQDAFPGIERIYTWGNEQNILTNPSLTYDSHVLQFQKVVLDPSRPERFIQLILATPEEDFSVYNNRLESKALLALCLLLTGSIAAAYFLAQYLTKPLHQIIETTMSYGKGIFTGKLPVETRDEIGDLARTIQQMIHDLEQRSAELQDSNILFQRILQYSTMSIFIKDLELKFRIVNRQFCESFGVSENQVIGKTNYDIFPQKDAERYTKRTRLVITTGKSLTFEESLYIKLQHDFRHFLATLFPLYDAEGNMNGICGMILDVTEQKKAEIKLKESEYRFKSVLDYSSNVIYLKNLNGHIITANRAFYNITHLTEEDVIGKTYYDIFPKEIADLEVRNIQNVIALKRAKTFEEDMLQDDGIHTYISVKYPLYDANGNIYAVCSMSTDITSRKHDEEALSRAKKALEQQTRDLELARKQAEEGSRAKSEFLANMSHEIRTPMNSVIGTTELLFNTELTKEQQEYVHAIYQGGEILLSLINDILDFSKIEAGEMEISHEPFRVNLLIDEIIQVFKGRAKQNNIILNMKGITDLPYLVIGDCKRLRQVIFNLVGNAVKFTQHGKVMLRIKKLAEDYENVTLRFEVEDTGIGIAPDKVITIFEKFIQADSFTTKKFGGTGLGLAISKQLTELMGGTIHVRSTLGKGSCFWIEIPFKRSSETDLTGNLNRSRLERQDIETEQSSHASQITASFHAKILLVEDYKPNQLVAKKMLEKMGCSVDIASDGEEALKILEDEHYDIIFMDVQMPEMDGFEATRLIRQDPDKANHVIIAMTANALEGDREKCLAAGMDDYVSKPIRASELESVLKKYLVLEPA